MMTTTPLKNSQLELSDYLEDVSSDAYPLTGHSTCWYGKLAQQSNLMDHALSASTVQSAFSGCLGTERIKGKPLQQRSGIDLIFLAPKSVSILALIGQDNRLIDAHNEAVKVTLDNIEADTAQVKVAREKGALSYDNSATMLFGLVCHYANHENEPQLHTHVLLPNMTRDKEGTLRFFASCLKQNDDVVQGTLEQIRHYQKYYSALYQGQLAKRAQSLGYVVSGAGQGQFEIQGIPQQLITALSSHQYQVEERFFAVNTFRSPPQNVAENHIRKKPHNKDLLKRWSTITKKLQCNSKSLISHCLSLHLSHTHCHGEEGAQPQYSGNDSAPALSLPKVNHVSLKRALKELSKYKTSFSMRKLIEVAAFEASKNEQANAIDLKRETHNWRDQGLLLPTSTLGLYTTQSMLSLESLLMRITKGLTRTKQNKVNRISLGALPLCHQSRRTMMRILESRKQFQMVEITGSNRQFVENLLALSKDLGISFHWVSRPERDFVIYTFPLNEPPLEDSHWIAQAFPKNQRHMLSTILSVPHYLGYHDILLFEDANRMSSNALIDMSTKAKEEGFKVILLNSRPRQQCNSSKDVFSIYLKGNVGVHQWCNTIHTKANVSVYEHDPKVLMRLYVNLTDRLNTQLVVTTKSAQRRLTEQVRSSLKNTGQMSYHGINVDTLLPQYLSKPKRALAHHYTPGMVLRGQHGNKQDDYTVIKHKRRSNTVEVCCNNNGEILRWNTASRTFRSLNLQPMRPQRLAVCLGDILIAQSKVTQYGLQTGVNYVVSKLDDHYIYLQSDHNQTIKLTLDALQGAPLDYGYVQVQDNVTPRRHTILFGKYTTLSSELLGKVTRYSQRVDIFTDDPQRTLIKLDKTRYVPLSIEQVVGEVTPNDSYLYSQTTTLLTEDVKQVLNVLGKRFPLNIIDKAVENAIDHLSKGQAALSQQALIVEAVRFVFNENNQSITQTKILDVLMSHSDLFSAHCYDGTRWVTTLALQTEKTLQERLEQGHGQHLAYLTPDSFHTRITRYSHISQTQKDALCLVSTTSNLIVAIQGLTRINKLSLLTSYISLIINTAKICQISTDRLMAVVPSHSAVFDLGNQGMQAQTLSNLIKQFCEKGAHTLPKGALYYFDINTVASNQDAVSFIQLLDASFSKAVLFSDTEQQLPTNSTKPFALAIQHGIIDTAYHTKVTGITAPLPSRANIIGRQQNYANIKQQRHTMCMLPHVISIPTETKSEENKALNSDTSLCWHVAQDYLNRTPDTREHTLTLAHSHTEQDAIAHLIRVGRRERGELGFQEVQVQRLRSIPTTKQALMTTTPYHLGLIVSHKPGHYAEIKQVDRTTGIVHTIDNSTRKKVSFLPHDHDPATTTLYSLSLQTLARGDRILSLTSRKTLGVRLNIDYVVTELTTQMILAKDREGHTITLKLDSLSDDSHWDYAYTRTSVMTEDCIYPFVITAIRSKKELAQFRHLHANLNRVSEHIRLYTHVPKDRMRRWLVNPSD